MARTAARAQTSSDMEVPDTARVGNAIRRERAQIQQGRRRAEVDGGGRAVHHHQVVGGREADERRQPKAYATRTPCPRLLDASSVVSFGPRIAPQDDHAATTILRRSRTQARGPPP